jgi:hypothetical protein
MDGKDREDSLARSSDIFGKRHSDPALTLSGANNVSAARTGVNQGKVTPPAISGSVSLISVDLLAAI